MLLGGCSVLSRSHRWLATQERDTLYTIHNGINATEPLWEQAEEWRIAEQRIPVQRITAGDNCEAHPCLDLRPRAFVTGAFKWYFGRFPGEMTTVLDAHGTEGRPWLRESCSIMLQQEWTKGEK
eukprot:IDg11504t1